MKYSVKVIFTYSVEPDNRKFYEESIYLVDAESFDDAYRKAEEYTKDFEDCIMGQIAVLTEDNGAISVEEIQDVVVEHVFSRSATYVVTTFLIVIISTVSVVSRQCTSGFVCIVQYVHFVRKVILLLCVTA